MVAVVAVVIVEAIEVVAIVEVIGLVEDVVVAAVVAEVHARTTTRRPLTSIVKTISPHCLDKLTLSLKKKHLSIAGRLLSFSSKKLFHSLSAFLSSFCCILLYFVISC